MESSTHFYVSLQLGQADFSLLACLIFFSLSCINGLYMKNNKQVSFWGEQNKKYQAKKELSDS